MSTSRNFGKVPGNAYKPGFIDTESPEMMKMSVDRELGEISKAFYKTDETVATKENSIYKGKWNPSSGAYPDANYENSWWDVETPNDTDYSFDGKVWRSFQKLIYDKSTLSYRLVEDWASATVKERIEKLEVSSGDTTAAIQELERVMIAEDTALAERITNLSTHVDTQNAVLDAKIEDYNTVQSNATSALANKVTTVETEYKAADATLTSSIQNEATARSTADSALATQISTVDANYKAADVVINASITSEATARANGDSALASQITTVKSELEGDIAAVQTYATTNINRIDNEVNAVEAKWGVRVNVNNKITGIQLNNNGNQTSFSVQADQFIISDGTNNNGAPFEVVGGVTKIKNAAVGTIASDNWNGSNVGWAITKDGYANFQNVIVRGNLSADTFTGVGGSGNTFPCVSRSKVTTGQVITLETFSISQALQQNSFILVNRPMVVLFGFGRVFLRLRRKDTNAIVASGYGMNYLSNINDGVSVTISLSGTLPAGYSGQLELEGYMDNSHGLGSGAWQADGGSNGDWTVYRAV